MPINLVFQGGGVRAIAYAGALDTMPPDVHLEAVAGTSAGAIVAALLGIGKSPREIKAILQDPELKNLIYPEDARRFQRLQEALRAMEPMLKGAINSGFSLRDLWRVRNHLRTLGGEFGFAWERRGFHRSDRLGEWLKKILEEKKFAEATFVKDVQIVASDISTQEYRVYTKETHPSTPLHEAVHASASIPLFFLPFPLGNEILVDGGILSNYPAFLFAGSKYPTVGFRLVDLTPPLRIEGTLRYLQAMFQTMAEAHDKKRPLPRHVFTYQIKTDVPFNRFALTDSDINSLLNAGELVGKTVRWKEHEKEERQVSFFDPKADETLEFSVAQARRLFDWSFENSQWVQTLNHSVDYTVRIDRDGTACYEQMITYEVEGDGCLFVGRQLGGGWPQGIQQGTMRSLMDSDMKFVEITGEDISDVIRIPAYNTPSHKGFVLVYRPPISAATGERKFKSRFQVDGEFMQVLRGEVVPVVYGVHRVAHEHILNLKITIQVDTEFPDLHFHSEFGVRAEVGEAASLIGTRYYKTRVWNIPPERIGVGVATFTIRIHAK